jgi:hypothetical protein
LPTIGFFPVTSHSRDTADSLRVPEFGKDREYNEKIANIQRLADLNCVLIFSENLTIRRVCVRNRRGDIAFEPD